MVMNASISSNLPRCRTLPGHWQALQQRCRFRARAREPVVMPERRIDAACRAHELRQIVATEPPAPARILHRRAAIHQSVKRDLQETPSAAFAGGRCKNATSERRGLAVCLIPGRQPLAGHREATGKQ